MSSYQNGHWPQIPVSAASAPPGFGFPQQPGFTPPVSVGAPGYGGPPTRVFDPVFEPFVAPVSQIAAPTENGFPETPTLYHGQMWKPLPILKQGSADLSMCLVPYDRITSRPEATLRANIDPDRVKQLMGRVQEGAHLPPVLVWQAENGDLVLLDGWHRLEVFRLIGVKLISVIVISDPLEKALVLAIRQNKPGNGGLRSNNDALRAVYVLATALGRPLQRDEATVLGLAFTEHEPVSPLVMKGWPVPVLSLLRTKVKHSPQPRKNPNLKARKMRPQKTGAKSR